MKSVCILLIIMNDNLLAYQPLKDTISDGDSSL